jgi:hypothetical protein
MKKAKIALTLFLALLVVVGVSFASLTEANFKPYHTPAITIFSPAQNQVYHSSNVLLNVSLDRYDTYPPFDIINSLNYSLDGQKDKPLPYTITAGIYCRGKITLSNLSDGPHSVFVHSEAKHGSEIIPFNATVSFTIETTIKPVVKQFPTVPVLTSSICIVAIAITVASLLIYFKKHNSKIEKPEKSSNSYCFGISSPEIRNWWI